MKNIPIIVGSTAYNISGRVVQDIDMIGTFEAITKTFNKIAAVHGRESQYAVSDSLIVLKTVSGLTIEGSIAWEGTSNADILDWVGKNNILTRTVTPKPVQVEFEHYVAPLVLCLLLKESHKYKDSVHFEKTREDVLALRSLRLQNNLSNVFSEFGLEEILTKREEETYRPAIKLNLSKDEFFANDGIDYSICPHDTIHELIALGSKPAYTEIQSAESSVMCDKKLWDAATEVTKMNCVIEEASVIAIERGILPYGKTFVDDEVALKLFKTALQKICTTLCSGWFREYAWINYDKIIQRHLEYEAAQNTNFIDIFNIDWKRANEH